MTLAEKEMLAQLKSEVKFLRQTVKNLSAAKSAENGLTREEALAMRDTPPGPPGIMDELFAAVADIEMNEDLAAPAEETNVLS